MEEHSIILLGQKISYPKTIMKKMVKLFGALLIVFSAAGLNAWTDSTFCKVINVEDEKHYQVLFQSPKNVDVTIQIFDGKKKLIYTDVLQRVNGFSQKFDLSGLKDGVYSFFVKSDEYIYFQDVEVKSWVGEHLRFVDLEGKVALVGKNDSGKDLDIVIYDGDGNLLSEEEIEKDIILNRLFNMEQMYGKEATILIYENRSLVKERIIKL